MRKLAWFAGAFSAAVFLAVYLLPEGDWPALWRPCWGCCSGVTAAGG